jgi:cell division protein FtsI/penicillin-binding protein 2
MRPMVASFFHRKQKSDWRLRALMGFFILFTFIVLFRLFMLQVMQGNFYQALASGQHAFYQELFAERGDIYIRDWMTGKEYLAATNEPKAFVYADPRRVEDPIMTAKALSYILGYEIIEPSSGEDDELPNNADEDILAIVEMETGDSEGEVVAIEVEEEVLGDEESGRAYQQLVERLSKIDDPYEPIARNIDDTTLQKILALDLSGIHYVLEKGRAYPETNLGGHVFGFVGADTEGDLTGRYGVEGFMDDFLAGNDGFIDAATNATDRWIGIGARSFDSAQDGGDLLLTIDRTIQYHACSILEDGVERYDAEGGALVILEPETGRIMAMCSVPNFDPNSYYDVETISVFNSYASSIAYEPGSVFKPLVVAAALDRGVVTPTTTYFDAGEVEVDDFTIRNSDLKSYGVQTMTEVLEKSLNTGMVHIMREMGQDALKEAVEDFGFGTLTGIELSGEANGTIASLSKEAEIYYATGSYGQGLTVTPLQLAAAYGALANGGLLMRPYIVEEQRFANGDTIDTYPEAVRQVVTKKTATTIGAMLVSVVENGYGGSAGVPGYYIAGKTGTAQVAREDGRGYQDDYTKATFVGYGPVEDPAYVMVVMLDHPRAVEWASDTSAPLFGEISEFLLQYLEVAPSR